VALFFRHHDYAFEGYMNKVSILALLLAAFSANVAAATSSQSLEFSNFNLAATDNTLGGVSGKNSGDVLLAFKQFDADIGVLTGISSTLNISAGTLKLSSAGTWGSGSDQPALSSNGTISATSNLHGIQFGDINAATFNCSGTSGGSRCFDSKSKPEWKNSTATDLTWANPTSAGTNNLDSYVGSDSLASKVTLTNTVSLTKADNINKPSATLAVTGLTGTQSIEFTYLKHANASFTSDSDTNSLIKDISGGAFNFSIYNHGTADTANLASKIGGFKCVAGNCDAFKSSSGSFNNILAGGGFENYGSVQVSDTASSGKHEATFALVFSDAYAGAVASNTLKDNALSLTVSATVAPIVSAVPEPETYAMLLAGLSVIGLKVRRRKNR